MPNIAKIPFPADFIFPAAHDFLKRLSAAEPPTGAVYHYTSFSNLKALIDSAELWASSIHYLNDASEFVHIRDLLAEEVNSRMKKEQDQFIRRFLESYLDHYFFLRRINESILTGRIYVVSFSEKENSLSQWRAYCREGGVSIGIKSDDLRVLANAHIGEVPADRDPRLGSIDQEMAWFARCEYSDDFKKEVIATLLQAVFEEIHRFRSGTDTPWQAVAGMSEKECHDALIFYLGRSLSLVAPFLKHSAFNEESEWRLVVSKNARSCRCVGNRLVPYVPLSLPAIESIMIGPCADVGQTMAAVDSLSTGTKRTGYCNIPYRPQ